MKRKYIVREITVKAKARNDQGYIEKRNALICVRDLETGVITPHPISSFIRSLYRNKSDSKSINTQLNPAREVAKFLNYITERIEEEHPIFIELKHKGIYGLRPIHGSIYITHKTREGLKANSVHRIERYLSSLYWFLKNEGIIEKLDIRYKPNFRTNKGELISPFRHYSLETEFPDNEILNNEDTLKDFGEKRFIYVSELINTARIVCPEIALGLCFQFFGGLRRGEVVNLTIDSIEVGEEKRDYFRLLIDDNQSTLFPNLKHTMNEGVKTRRRQTLLLNNLLFEVYAEHISMLKKSKPNNPKALFVSPRSKEAISGGNYAEKFKLIKRAYLSQLIETGRFQDFEDLNVRWSTHLGRGVFTNFLLGIGLNPTQVAIARGDKNLDSVLSYIEKRNLISNMNSALKEIEASFRNGKANIETNHIVTWKEFADEAYRTGEK